MKLRAITKDEANTVLTQRVPIKLLEANGEYYAIEG